MSGGVTTLELHVKADKRGLDELQSAFAGLNASITANLGKLQTASRNAAAGGAQELAQMKAQLSQLQAGLATTQALIAETGKKGEEAAHRRTAALDRATHASRRHTEAMRAEKVAAHELHSGMRGLAGGMGLLWTTYGSFLPLVSGFALSAGIKKAIDLGSEFTYQMQFAGAVADASAKELDVASNAYLRLAENSKFSATEIASGYRVLAQAGFNSNEALRVMPELLKFSTVGEIEMGKAAEVAAGQMHSFGLSIDQVPHMLNSTAKAAAISQTTIAEMGQALRQASTVALQYNVSIDEMNALLAVLAQRNIRGSAAGTALRNMFRELDPHTERAKRAMRELGISVTDAEGRYKKIIPLLQEFSEKFSQYDQVSQARLADSLFNERGAKAFLNAMAQSRGALQQFFGELQNSDKYLDDVSKKLNDTFKIQATQALNSLQVSAIEAFNAVQPAFTELAAALKQAFQSQEFKDGLKTVLGGFADLTRWLIANKELVVGFAVGLAGLNTALKMTAGAAALIKGTAIGLTGGVVGFALFGAAGAAYLLVELDKVVGKMLQIAGIKLPNAHGGGVLASISGSIVEALMGDKDAKLAQRARWERGEEPKQAEFAAYAEWQREAARARDAREQRERLAADDELQRKLRTGARPTISPEELARSAAQRSSTAGTLRYSPDAPKEAAMLAQDEIARYREAEQRLRVSTEARLAIARAYHQAGLSDDRAFMAEQELIGAEAYTREQGLLNDHLAKLKKLRAGADDKQRLAIDREIDRAQAQLHQNQMKREVDLAVAQARNFKEYTSLGEKQIEAIEKKNAGLRAEVEAITALKGTQQDATVTQIDATVAKLEHALATKEAETEAFKYSETLTLEQQVQLRGVEAIRKQVEELKKLRGEYINLQAAKKAAENDWQAGAIKGLQQYLDSSLSTAKMMQDGFKKAFGAMEEMLVDFVMTGKLNFKDFANSVIKDVLRIIVQTNITKPLAQGIQNWLGGGGGIGGLVSALFGGGGPAAGNGGPANIFSGIGSFGSGGLMGGALTGIGTFLGGMGGSIGAFGSGLAMTGQVGLMNGFLGGVGAMGSGGFAAGLGAMLPGLGWALAVGSMLYSLFGGRRGGPKEEGAFLGLFDPDGTVSQIAGQAGRGPGALNIGPRDNRALSHDPDMRAAAATLAGEYFSAARALGGSSSAMQFGLGISTDPRGTASPFLSGLVRDAQGNTIFSEFHGDDDLGRSEEEFTAAMAQMNARMLLAALQSTDFADEIDQILDGVGDPLQASVEAIEAALKAAGEMRFVLQGLDELTWGNLTVDALREMQNEGETLAQTFERVAGTMLQFDAAFMSEEQKLKSAHQDVLTAFSQLGIAIPSSAQGFYDLVHGLDLSTEAGRTMFNALMSVAPAFATVSNAAAQAVANFHAVAGQLSSSHGQQFARANLESAVGQWMALSENHRTGWTVDSTIANIQTLVNTQGGLSSALAYAQSLGDPTAVQRLTDMVNAWGQWQSAMNQSNQSVSNFTQVIDTSAASVGTAFDNWKKDLEGWAKSKLLGSDSPLLPAEKLNFALNEYEKILKSGNGAAFQGAAEELLSQGRAYHGSSDDYTALFNRVIADAEKLGGFKLNYQSNVQAASIDQMRSELLVEMRLAREQNMELRGQVDSLIRSINEAARQQIEVIRETAEATARRIANAVESTVRS